MRVCFPFVSLVTGEGDSHAAALWLIDRYDVLVIDIYSCDRPYFNHSVEVVVVGREPEVVVSDKIFPAPGCVSCLGFRFISPLITRRLSSSRHRRLKTKSHYFYQRGRCRGRR